MIDLRADIAFKKIFGVEANKDLLLSLLNAIVSEEDQIAEVELLNPYNERKFEEDRLSILDIKARNKHTGAYYLIEMQIANDLSYHKRSLYGWARVYADQLQKNNEYRNLVKTIGIHILNFVFIDYENEQDPHLIKKEPQKYHHRFLLVDEETGVKPFKDIEIHTIELSKFAERGKEDLPAVLKRVKDMLDKWVTVLTQCRMLDFNDLPKEVETPEIRRALEELSYMSMNQEEREQYERRMDSLRLETQFFREKFEQGMAAGLEKGLHEGVEKGRLEEKRTIAKNLLAQNIAPTTIAAVTDLSLAEIEAL